ncbi:MAG: phosphate acyltransferase [Rikenellaceae bacterium]
MIQRLDQLIDAAKLKGKRHLVVAYANDAHTIGAVNAAIDCGIVDVTLFGSRQKITAICEEHSIDCTRLKIMEFESDTECVKMAVAYINQGKADILMKGVVSTDKYMRGILSKDGGLVPSSAVLSHVTIIEIPSYYKLLTITDVAVIPAPDLSQKVALTRYVISVAHSLGITMPKVAIIAPTEQMLPKLPSCVDAAIISKMGDRGQITGALIDGPLAIDVALDKETAKLKNLVSKVDADADCLVFPNIEAANAFFKCCTKLCNGSLAAIVMGAKVPCVLTSRGDSEKSKLYSIALAVLNTK